MKTHRIIIVALTFSTFIFTSCQKDSFTKVNDFQNGDEISEYINELPSTSSGSTVHNLSMDMEGQFSVDQPNCMEDSRQVVSYSQAIPVEDCDNMFKVTGEAYGLSGMFGHFKASVEFEYNDVSGDVNGSVLIHKVSTDEYLTIKFRGSDSDLGVQSSSSFRALSIDTYNDKYFTGTVEINNLGSLLYESSFDKTTVQITGLFE